MTHLMHFHTDKSS